MTSRERPVLLGVTGGIGTGKSLVCKILSTFGYPVYNADDRAKELMNESIIIREKIIDLLGNEAYSDHSINRQFIASKVFKDSELLKKLNAIVHPEVGKDFQSWVNGNGEKEILIKEAALLVEAGSYRQLDYLIVVSSPIDIRIERILSRDPQRSKDEVEAIIAKQMNSKELEEYADFVLLNDEENSVLTQIRGILDSIKRKSRLETQPA